MLAKMSTYHGLSACAEVLGIRKFHFFLVSTLLTELLRNRTPASHLLACLSSKARSTENAASTLVAHTLAGWSLLLSVFAAF